MANRAQVAAYVAEKLQTDRREAVKSAAAWLVATGRARQAEYLAQDVARELAASGYLYVRVTTARHLSDSAWDRVEDFIKSETGAKQIELNKVVDRSIIGGVRIETPEAEFDGTVRTKLAKFVEGAVHGL
jgi:F-type H+-transporting ATPase subunit delta